MSAKTINLTPELHQYLINNSVRDSELKKELRAETAKLEMARMQVSPEHGQLIAFLVELTGAKNVLELGTFTGYSTFLMASALPEDGKLIACDVSEEWTNIAKTFWQKGNLSDKIDLRIAPAMETLGKLQAEDKVFDLAFIDADQESFVGYYEQVLKLIRKGGLIIIDNVLWSGRVADDNHQEPSTKALRELNKLIHKDERVTMSMVPIGDGLTLVRKR